MVSAFDNRIIQVGIQFDDKVTTFAGLSTYASGRKYGSAIMNECELRIYNLTRDQRNYILSQSSPLKIPRTLVRVTLDVGRESYGTFRLFEGDVISCNATQPPDIGIILRSLTSNYLTGLILGTSQSSTATLQSISQTIASQLGLALEFKATKNKQIDNYTFNGGAAYQIDELCKMGGVNAFIDNGTLVVLDNEQYRTDKPRLISSTTGMIGIPQVTETGVLVRVMIDNSIELGGSVEVQSELNPAANGTYKVWKINFEVANRDQQFWYILECVNPNYYLGSQ